MLCFNFSSVLKKVFISFLVSFSTWISFPSKLFSFHEFVCCLSLYLLLISTFNPWRSDRTQGIISIFQYLLNLISVLMCDLFCRKFHQLPRIVLLVFGVKLCRCLFSYIWVMTSFNFSISVCFLIWTSCLMVSRGS